MPGRPRRRARLAAGIPESELCFPVRVPEDVWRQLSSVERLHVLYGEALEAALIDLSYRGNDYTRLQLRAAARHDVLNLASKWAQDGARKAERDAAIERLARLLRESGVSGGEVEAAAVSDER